MRVAPATGGDVSGRYLRQYSRREVPPSSHPAVPLRAELGFAQFVSVAQGFAPEATAPRQFNTAVLSAVLSANAAASAPGVREHCTPGNTVNARDREIGIPLGSIFAGAGLDARRRVGDIW